MKTDTLKALMLTNLILAVLTYLAEPVLILLTVNTQWIGLGFFVITQITIIWLSLIMTLCTTLLTLKKPCLINFTALLFYFLAAALPIIRFIQLHI